MSIKSSAKHTFSSPRFHSVRRASVFAVATMTTVAMVSFAGPLALAAVATTAPQSLNTLQAAGGTIRGTLKNAKGEVVPSMAVRLVIPFADADAPTAPAEKGALNLIQGGKPGVIVKSVTSDASGNFTFAGIKPGSYLIWAGMGRNGAKQKITVKDGDNVINVVVGPVPTP